MKNVVFFGGGGSFNRFIPSKVIKPQRHKGLLNLKEYKENLIMERE